jgi:uncharacterized DUF497 family protein
MHPRDAEGFEWDAENEDHLAPHAISSWEVEEVFWHGPVWVPNQKGRSGDWKMIGRTTGGRAITVVVRTRPDQALLRAITGWDCTPGEQTRYLRRKR